MVCASMKIRKRYFFFIIFLLIANYLSAQKEIVFKNKKLYKVVEELTLLSETNPKQFIKKIDSVSNTINNEDKELFEIEKHFLKGCAYRNLRDFENLTFHFEKTKELAIENGYRQIIAEVYREMGDEYIDSDDFKKAIDSYKKATEVYKEFNNEEGVIKCIYEGFIESLQGKYKLSNKKLKKLLPTFKKVNPIYLDALSTIAFNYQELNNIDSAFVYVNKMPLDTEEDLNNFNYQQHKNYISTRYYIEKKNIAKANEFNEKIQEARVAYGEEADIYYFQNKIDIAILNKDLEGEKRYRDSLNNAYENRMKILEKSKIYNTDTYISLNKETKEERAQAFRMQLVLVLTSFVLMMLLYLGWIRYKKQKLAQQIVVENMQREIQQLILEKEVIQEQQVANYKDTIVSTTEKIKELSRVHGLTKRETDILFQITKGYNNQQIGDTLFISVNTVKYHTRNIYQKLDVKKRGEITAKLILEENESLV